MTADASDNAETLRAREWLLGRLAEPEAEQFEGEILESADRYEAIRSVEAELFDEFQSGRMTAADREAFLLRYRTPADREKLAFARALATRAATPNVVRTSRFGRTFFLAAAAVLLTAVTALLLRPGAGGPPAASDTVAEVVPPTDTAPAPAAPAPAIAEPVLRAIEVTIVLGTARSEGSASEIVLPPDAGAVTLHVVLDPADAYDRYRVQLHGPDGALAFERDDLVSAMRGGARSIETAVPAGVLRPGAWELAVAGVSGGEADDLGFQTIAVRRSE